MSDFLPAWSMADRQLLYGLLALEGNWIEPDNLAAALRDWASRKDRQLGSILLTRGWLSEEQCAELDVVFQKRALAHDHDPRRTLASLSLDASLRTALHQLGDPDLDAVLERLDGPPTRVTAGPARILSGPAEDPGRLSPGSRFRILRSHARGGIGEVFVAVDLELNREVALKRVRDHLPDPAETWVRFVREAEVTGGLEHPGIVPVYGLGRYVDGRPFYAMRFVRGESLQAAIDHFHRAGPEARDPGERALEFRQLLGRFLAVCNTMEYAHSRGVLHRDLKPANIMLGQFGETLVVDWGLARPIGARPPAPGAHPAPPVINGTSSDSALTQMGRAMGTPAYMSPEQAAGSLDELGPATDIYSLGATLYCLLTGKAPLTDTNAPCILERIQGGDFPRPRQRDAHIPPALEAVCLRAMALRPAERYPSVRALADDLEHWLADEPVAACREPAGVRLGRWTRRHRGFVVAGIAACVLAVTVTTAWALVRASSAREAHEQALRGVAERERGEAEGQRALVRRLLYFSRINMADRFWQEAQVARMRQVLNEQAPLDAGREDLRGFEWYYLNRLPERNQRTLAREAAAVLAVAYDSAGKRVAGGLTDGRVKIWDAGTGRVLFDRRHGARTVAVAFSPDGKRLASAADGTVKVWDVDTGMELFTFGGHAGMVTGVAFSPDGRRLASASWDLTVKVWDLTAGRDVLTLAGHASPITSVAFSPDGRRVAAGAQDGSAKVWDLNTGRENLTLHRHAREVAAVAFSPDGKRLATASFDQTVRVSDLAGQEVAVLAGHHDRVVSICFGPDGRQLASASYDGTIKVWDVAPARLACTLRGHAGRVHAVSFHPDGTHLASCSDDQTVKVWVAADQESITLVGHARDVNCAAFSPGGVLLATGSSDGAVKLWDARTWREVRTLKAHERAVYGVAFSPDGKRLASASADKTVTVWDLETFRQVCTCKGHTAGVNSVAFCPDGRRLASASDDRTVKVWNLAGGQEEFTLTGHTAEVNKAVFSPDGGRLASASYDNTVKVWDVVNRRELFTFHGHTDRVHAVAFSPDGSRVASGSQDQTVRIWDAKKGRPVLTLPGHTQRVMSVAFSPDGRRLASSGGVAPDANQAGEIKLWDPAAGQEALTLRGHNRLITGVVFSPAGRLLASTSDDGTVKIWDATQPTEPQPPPGASLSEK